MLDRAQIDAFHRDGFLVMRGLIQGRELELLQAAADRVVAEGVARSGEHHLYGMGLDGAELYRRSEKLWQRDPVFRAVSVNPALLENIGQCIGHEFFPWNDSLVVKVPRGGPVGWHQDPPYGQPEREETYVVPNFTTDIYLDDSDEDNGCVWALPGRHLVGHVRTEERSEDELFTACGAVPVPMRAGDVLFHALSAPHGSRANPSPTRTRRTFYIHYLTQEVHDQCGYRWGKLSWGEEKRAQLAQMASDRRALGLGEAFGPYLREGEEGLRFTGAVTTPRRWWGELARRLTPAQRAELKSVKALAAAAAR